MKENKFAYGWALKWILAAILIAAGVLLYFLAEKIVYLTTGIAIVLFSLLRIVPLMKTLKKEVLRTINLIEVIFDTIMGGLMIYVVFASGTIDISDFWIKMYGFFLAVFFYARGLIYFISAHFFGEKTEGLKFWFHIACMTLGPAIFVLSLSGTQIVQTLGWLVIFIAIAGGLYLGYDGFGGFKKYREQSKRLNEEKNLNKPAPEKELPKPIQQEPEKEKEQPFVS